LEEGVNELLPLRLELPEALLDNLEGSNWKEVNADFERKAQVVEVTTNLSIESPDGLQFCRIQQMF